MLLTEGKYQHLGNRAFWIFFFQNARAFYAIAGFALALATLKRVFIFPDEIALLIDQVMSLLVSIYFLVLVATFLGTLLQYIAFEFMLDEHAFKIRSGIINLNIDAIPYRQMQNIDIERDLLYRLLGVSKLVILTAGTEDPDVNDESEGVIPALDKHLAAAIQQELIKRANQERISVTNVAVAGTGGK